MPDDARLNRQPAVLLIEDDPDTQDMYATYLVTRGLSVLAARNGMEGFSRACEMAPDVIVTDVMLPNIDGWELVERLRADGRTSQIPVLIVTGCSGPDLEDRARRLGARFLMKPCLPDALANEICQVLPASASGAHLLERV